MPLKTVDELNYYELLNVPRNFKPVELEKAVTLGRAVYGRNSLSAYGLISEKEKERCLARVEEAYATLSHPERRKLYDRQIFKGVARLGAAGLVKTYGRRTVVRNVDVEVRSGEIIGLLGRNGAGKTTLFQMIVGLVKPDAGEIKLNGKPITEEATNTRANLGVVYLPQESSVFLKASVRDNLRLVLELQPYSRAEREVLARDLLAELGLLPLARQKAHSLSGGERRKLEICRSLVLRPKFLLLDEPFTGIDPLTVAELQKIILGLKAKGIGIILSDHNVRDTFKITSRVYIIDKGEVLVEGAPAEVARNKEAQERFLGREFHIGGEVLL